MKRRIGSLFYRSNPQQQEGARRRWHLPSILGGFLRKTCIVLGAIMLFSILLGIVAGMIVGDKGALPDDMILTLDATQPIGETDSGRSLMSPLEANGATVQDIVATLDRAGRDERVRGLLVNFETGGVELAHIQELRAAVKRFRAAGKFAHFYTASFADLGSGIGAYYLASAFDEVWMQPVGFVTVSGLALEMPFARDVLDKVGANPEFLHREEYKSAMESFTNSEMSAPNREMMTSIVEDFAMQIAGDITRDRKIDAKTFQPLVDRGLIPADEAMKAGLVNRLGYSDLMLSAAREKVTGEEGAEEPETVSVEDYFDATLPDKPSKRVANVALVRVSGEIIPGSEPEPGYATGEYIAEAIHDAADDDKIKIIVVRVDSPGGSPSASETIRRALLYAKERDKKILVSMGPVAASGGYWLTVDADRIFALPSTLTGSIGVIMGKFELSRLWDKVGVNWQAISWGENATMWSMNQKLTDSERQTLNQAIDATYTSFINRVANGRGMKQDEVRKLAKGRAWTGLQAKKNGLVDEIGGLDTTLDYAVELLKVSDRSRLRIVELPEPLSPIEQLMVLLGDQVSMGKFDLAAAFGVPANPYAKRMEAMRRGGPVQAYADLPVVNP